ncbi:aldehyde dehydrogenase [Methanomicrobiaceae archaeon CYW5]|uniref:aldehyde dehydrogenase family protein n=1 Tax=Methanovulcanius yangii TaxID=1789227 RepID=UPI0029CA053F|nr:aldehyde dehydrogenase family protein [Methanovulcanius yangii]MBT8508475.1 aldehyde dehydrogenase [Methanovulcanius yangii]
MEQPMPCIVGGVRETCGNTFEVRSPYDGSLVASVCRPGRHECGEALARAAGACGEMATLPAYRRAEILSCLGRAIEDHSDELADILVREVGKPRKFAEAEVMRAASTILLTAEEATRCEGDILPLDRDAAADGRTGFLTRVPAGVVLGITPFNFPLNLACHKLGPAIAAGCPIVLKPSTATPVATLLLGEMALDAGVPPAALSVLPCTAEDAEWMAKDPRVAVLSFTGSPSVGWHLKRATAARHVALELGGNAAVIVHSDAPLEYAAERIVQGGYSNSGQVCISTQRVLVHRPVYDHLCDMVVRRVAGLVTGDPADPATDVGPLISEWAAETAEKKIRDAVGGGAELLCGGTREGRMVVPTVLGMATAGAAVCATELFAPAVVLLPYETWDEALAMAADTPYGLQAGIFTNDMDRIMEAVRCIPVGGLMVGDIPTFRTDAMPYGGVRLSGMGREGPRYAIREMTEEKLVVLNRHGLRRGTGEDRFI